MKVKFAQSCPTLWDSTDCSTPGSSVHGILQVAVLEWVAILFSSGSSCPRDQTQVLYIAGRFFTVWATREALALGLIGLEKLPGCLCVNSERYFPTGSPWLICLCPRCLCRYRLLWPWDYSDTHSGTVGIGLDQRRERISGADSASPQMLLHRKPLFDQLLSSLTSVPPRQPGHM